MMSLFNCMKIVRCFFRITRPLSFPYYPVYSSGWKSKSARKSVSVEFRKTMGQYKIDSRDWTLFSFVLHLVPWKSVEVMVPTVFDKTQARARKSIFCLKSYKNVVLNHLDLIRDKLKIVFEAEKSGLKWGGFKNGIDSTCRLETTSFAKPVVKMCLVVP